MKDEIIVMWIVLILGVGFLASNIMLGFKAYHFDNLEKQIVRRGYATYDVDGNFQWKENPNEPTR